MKVRVTLTVEIDKDAWALAYGPDPSALRDDVKSYVVNAIQQSAAAEEGAITDVTER